MRRTYPLAETPVSEGLSEDVDKYIYICSRRGFDLNLHRHVNLQQHSPRPTRTRRRTGSGPPHMHLLLQTPLARGPACLDEWDRRQDLALPAPSVRVPWAEMLVVCR